MTSPLNGAAPRPVADNSLRGARKPDGGLDVRQCSAACPARASQLLCRLRRCHHKGRVHTVPVHRFLYIYITGRVPSRALDVWATISDPLPLRILLHLRVRSHGW